MLKNTSRSKSQLKGLKAEETVLKFFQSKDWELVSHRSRIHKIEIDLILQKENRIVLIEVKFLDQAWRSFDRIHSRQVQRLKRALLVLRCAYPQKNVGGYVAFVSRQSGLHFVSLDEII